MAKITTINEPWDRHDYPEVEEFVKAKLKEYKDEAEELAYTEHPELMPLTFEAVGDATTVKFYAYDDGSGDLHAKTIEVSTDGATWTEKTSTADGTTLATLNAGQKLYVRGNNEAYGWYSGEDYMDDAVGNFFAADKNVYVYGNVMSLVIGDDALSGRQVALAMYAFACLFHNYNGAISGEFILSHPTKNLVLPATTLANDCYNSMFSGCTGLTSAPVLPATTLAVRCYSSMFNGCRNLSYIKALFAPMNTSYLSNWVKGVSASGTFVKSPSLTMIMYGDSGVPNNWDIEDAS